MSIATAFLFAVCICVSYTVCNNKIINKAHTTNCFSCIFYYVGDFVLLMRRRPFALLIPMF